MSTAIRCDRCKTYYDERPRRKLVRVFPAEGQVASAIERDLCQPCQSDLNDWWNRVGAHQEALPA